MRISVTIPDQLLSFVQHLHTRRGMSISAALCYVVQSHPEFSAYEKDLTRQAAETAKASVKTTVVVEARPTREDMLAEERERQRRIREREAHPPWPTPPEPETVTCHHGFETLDKYGNTTDCIECAVEDGKEVCHKHTEVQPCVYCSMDEVGEAAP